MNDFKVKLALRIIGDQFGDIVQVRFLKSKFVVSVIIHNCQLKKCIHAYCRMLPEF
jgi:hypothetical protein